MVRASASSTKGLSERRSAETERRAFVCVPRPGPAHKELMRASARICSRSPIRSNPRVMIAFSCAACSFRARVSPATVTSPAPTRSAPRAARRAAPPRPGGPETTSVWPWSYLWCSERFFERCPQGECCGCGEKRRRITVVFYGDVPDGDVSAETGSSSEDVSWLRGVKRDCQVESRNRIQQPTTVGADPARDVNGDHCQRRLASCPHEQTVESTPERTVKAGPEKCIDNDRLPHGNPRGLLPVTRPNRMDISEDDAISPGWPPHREGSPVPARTSQPVRATRILRADVR